MYSSIDLSPAELRRLDRLAEAIRRDHPELAIAPPLSELVAPAWSPAPTLHLDDQSAITTRAFPYDTSFIQDRARIRAEAGDIVACNLPPVEGYEEYCRLSLGLSEVEWIAPETHRHRRQLAGHCWTSRPVRRRLVRAVKSDGLRWIHPLMGSAAVWQLALLLRRATRSHLSVLAPPPELTHFVNDKTEFAHIVGELFGAGALPRSRTASSLALVASRVQKLAAHPDRSRIALKLPDAAGGSGNIVLESAALRRKSLVEIRRYLAPVLRRIDWRSGEKLQISSWEQDVLSAPSIQTWIPPERDLPPRVDGLFEQLLAGAEGEFVGARPAHFPKPVRDAIVYRGLMLASLFKRLGYVGRCSFDLVLTGRTLETSRAVLIECNGRWGGTSLPMLLVRRLVAQRKMATPAFVVRSLLAAGLRDVSFRHLLEHFADDLFDVTSGRGWLVLFDPARMRARSGLSYIALASREEEAVRLAEERLPLGLRRLLRFRRRSVRVGLP